jgi:hypothetical protein
MNKQPSIIRRTFTGDWWYFAGALKALLTSQGFTPNDGPQRDGRVLYAGGDWTHDQVTITGKDSKTTMVVEIYAPERAESWRKIVLLLEEMAIHARFMRQQVIGTTPQELIETYYRSRAAGGKVTLKQLAQQAGISYSYLTKAKMAYDHSGKFGSGTERKSERSESDSNSDNS